MQQYIIDNKTISGKVSTIDQATARPSHLNQHQAYYQYNPFRIPPNIRLCQKHYSCTKFGKVDRTVEACPCCRNLNKTKLSLNCSINEITEVSSSAGYYFVFLRNLMLCMFAVFIFHGIPMYQNFLTYCSQNNTCFQLYGVKFRNYQLDYKTSGLLDCIILLIFNIFSLINTHSFLTKNKIQETSVKASHYSVLIEGVQHQKIYTEDIFQFLERNGFYDTEILYTHRISNYMFHSKQKCNLKSNLEFMKIRESNYLAKKYIWYAERQLQKIQNLLKPIHELFQSNNELFLRTDKIFISFKSYNEKERFVKKFKKNIFQRFLYTLIPDKTPLIISGISLNILSLPQPNQIIWENLEVTQSKSLLLTSVTNLISMGILVGANYLLGKLYIFKIAHQDKKHKNYHIQAFIASLIISAINVIISWILTYLIQKQRKYSSTQKQISLFTKQTANLFVNTALIPLIMLTISERPMEKYILENVIYLILQCAFMYPFLLLFNTQAIIKSIKRNMILTKSNHAVFTQGQANLIFQKADFQIFYKYALISALLLFSVFYSSTFPLCTLISCLGFLMYYFVSKYMLINHTKTLHISHKIGRRLNHVIYLLPFVYCFGEVSNSLIVYGTLDSYILITFIVSIISSLLAFLFYQRLVIFFLTKNNNYFMYHKLKPTRDEALRKSMIDYKHVNPTSCEQKRHASLGTIVRRKSAVHTVRHISQVGSNQFHNV